MKALKRWGRALLHVVLVGAAIKAVWMPWALLTEEGKALSRFEYVRGQVLRPRANPSADLIAGEWSVGAISMAAAAAAQLNAQDPSHAAERVGDLEQLSDEILSAPTAQFDTAIWREEALATLEGPNGHIGYLGHTALTLAAACALGSARHAEQLTRIADALARRLDAAPDALLETYPHSRWIPDNLVVAAALAQTDRCREERRYAPTLSRFFLELRQRWVDQETGLLMFTPQERPRGSGATWNVFYLALADDALAREQWGLARQHFLAAPFPGLAGFREFLPGVDGRADVDSGPVVFGISTSAGGFGFAGAALEGDAELLAGLRRTAELFGFSAGSRRHYLDAPLVGEAIVLAMATARPWQPGPHQRWGARPWLSSFPGSASPAPRPRWPARRRCSRSAAAARRSRSPAPPGSR